jgi:hypothetical protein
VTLNPYVLLHFAPPLLVACFKRCQQGREPEAGAPETPASQPSEIQPKPRQTTDQAKQDDDQEVQEPPFQFEKYALQAGGRLLRFITYKSEQV